MLSDLMGRMVRKAGTRPRRVGIVTLGFVGGADGLSVEIEGSRGGTDDDRSTSGPP